MLNLSCNNLSSEISTLYELFHVMVSQDLHNNNLTGKITLVGSLLNQGLMTFTENPFFCGVCPSQIPPKYYVLVFFNWFTRQTNDNIGFVILSLIFGVSLAIRIMFFFTMVYRKNLKCARYLRATIKMVGRGKGRCGEVKDNDESDHRCVRKDLKSGMI